MRNVLNTILFLFVSCNVLYAQTFNSTGSTAIPDAGLFGAGPEVCNSISVSGLAGPLSNTYGIQRVCINISHGSVGDLVLNLVAPDGTRILLSDQNGGTGDDYNGTCFVPATGGSGCTQSIVSGTAPFSGDFTADGSDISTLNNGVRSGNGTWQLCAQDQAWITSGTINSWSVTFAAPSGGSTPLPYTKPCYTFGLNAGADQSFCPSATCQNVTLQATSAFDNRATDSYVVQEVNMPSPAYNVTGTNVIVDDDDVWSGVVPLGFNFCFFGNTYSSIVIGANGLISFDLTYAGDFCDWSYTGGIPDNTKPLNSIMGPYTDIDPSVGFNANRINYYYEGTAPCRRLIINFYQVPNYSSTCNSQLVTSQIILHESYNIVDVVVPSRPVCTTWNGGNAIIGIQNAAGTTAYSAPCYNPNTSTFSNKAFRFYPNGALQVPSVAWYQNGTQIATGLTANVCVNTNSTYVVQQVNSLCSGGTITLTDTVQVLFNSAPTATIATPVINCGSTTTTLNGTGSSAGTYGWTGPAGSTITNGNTITPTVNTSGTYVLTVTSANGCTSTASVNVNLNSTNLTLNAGADRTVCKPASTQLGGSPTGPAGVTYTWSAIDGLPTGVSLSSTSVSNPTVTIASNAISPQTISFEVFGQDAGGCTGRDTVIVTVANATADAGADKSVCAGNSVQIGGSPTGAVGSTYTWSPATNLSSSSVSNPTVTIPAGTASGTITYTVTVTTGTCTAVDQVVVTINNATANAGADQSVCAGSSVSIGGSPTGQVGSTYAWSPTTYLGATGNTANPTVTIPAGTASGTITYTVTVTTGTCTAVDQVVVTINNATADAGTDKSVCVGSSIGIGGSPTGQAGSTYAWSPTTYLGATGNIANPTVTIPAGTATGTITYTVTVTTGTCTAVDQVVVTINNATADAGADRTICDGNSTSIGTALPVGATIVWTSTPASAISYLNNPNIATPIVTIPSGTSPQSISYSATVTVGTCTASDAVIVTVQNCCGPFNILPTIVNNSRACNPCNGSISLAVTTTNTGLTYAWSNGGNTNAITGLCAGDYTVTISSSIAGCDTTITYTITQPPQMVVSGVITNEGCNNQPGQIVAVVTNGSPSYTYTWSANAATGNSNVAVNLSDGVYSVTVTDANGCTDSEIFEVLPYVQLIPVIDAHNVVCGEPGTIDVTVRDGNAPYNFAWSSNAPIPTNTTNSTSLDNLSAGTYTLTITDNTNCASIFDVIISETTKPIVNITGNPQMACIGESITLTATGANAYQWSTGQTGNTITVPVTGTQIISVVGSIGTCISDVDTFRIDAYPIPNVNISGNTDVCASNTILTATSGYANYIWRDNAGVVVGNTNTLNVSSSGTYTVTVSGGGNCTAVASANVTINNRPTASITPNPTINGCVGSNYSLTGSGASNFVWSTGQTTSIINRPITGSETISLVVFDNPSCLSLPTYVAITPYPTPVLTMLPGTNVNVCNDRITIRTTPGYTSYVWTDGSGTIVGGNTDSLVVTNSGTYTVVVSNANGCTASVSSVVSLSPRPVATIAQAPFVSGCLGSAVTLNGSGATNLLWSTGQFGASITRPITGNETISLIVFDNPNCPSLPTFVNIQANPLPNVRILEGSNINICGNSTIISATPGFVTYEWRDASNVIVGTSQTLNVTSSGNYTVTVQDANGCRNSETTLVTLTPRPVATINPAGPINQCVGTSVNLNGFGATNFIWSTGEGVQNITRNITGDEVITLVVYDDMNCQSLPASVIIKPNPLPEVRILPGTIINTCASQYQVRVSGSYSNVEWLNSANTVIANGNSLVVNAPGGTYYVRVTNIFGCVALDTVQLTLNQPNFTVDLSSANQTVCSSNGTAGGSVEVSVNPAGNYTYNWSTGSNSSSGISNVGAGTYFVTVQDANGCVRSQSITLAAPPSLSAIIEAENITCLGDDDGEVRVIASNGTAPYSYSWSNGSNNDTISNVSASGYSVTVTDNRQCTQILSATVLEGNIVNVDAGDTVTLYNNTPVTLFADNDANTPTYLWSITGQTTQSIVVNPNQTTTYTVVVTDNRGCKGEDDVTVKVPADVFAVPNAFTPNGDGRNETFWIAHNGTITVLDFKVFNRWGELIYNKLSPWDGTFKGELQPVSTYVYVFKIRKNNGEEVLLKGDFSIIK